MGIGNIQSTTGAYESSSAYATQATDTTANTSAETAARVTAKTTPETGTEAATYEKSSDAAQSATSIVDQMKADAEQRTAQLRSLVEKMMLKQGVAVKDENSMYEALRTGKLSVDPSVAEQARKDIADDGYWGVEQTSDRLVSFAKALAGNDPEYADKMMEAIQKGYDEATKAWGDELPDISQRTLDATMKKMEEWKSSVKTTTETQAETVQDKTMNGTV